MADYEGGERRKHTCDKEVFLSEMKSLLTTNTTDTKKVLKLLEGNGGVGIKTQVELNKASLTRLIAWLGGLTVGLGTIAFFAIRALLT